MKELRVILEAYEKLRNNSSGMALATIVKAKGSTYRRAGARMLLTVEGEMVGSISGGCLEGDLLERAKKVMQSGKPEMVRYDTSSDDDLVWGLGLGCAGVVDVLVESLATERPDHIAFLADCVEHERAGVMATVIRVEGSAGVVVGSRLLLRKGAEPVDQLGNHDLSAAVLPDARDVLASGRSVVKEYGSTEVFIEALQPPVPLVILGAGHDAIPVAKLAKDLGWSVTVADSRAAFLTRERFASADKVILSEPQDVLKHVRIEAHSAVVIMSHNYAHDRNYLGQLLGMPVRYLAVLGPKKRTEMLIQDLRKDGIAVTDEQVSRLFSPAGMDMGAETPEEIALAIIGEIQTVLAGRSGGLLRDRKGPIHSR